MGKLMKLEKIEKTIMGDLQEQKTSFDHLSSCDYPILLKLKIYNLMHDCSSLKKFHLKKTRNDDMRAKIKKSPFSKLPLKKKHVLKLIRKE